MSVLNEEEEKLSSIFEDKSLSSPNLNYKESSYINNEDDNSQSSLIFSDKQQNLFINNENFINYFMHIDYNTPLNQESIDELKKDIYILNDKSNLKESNISSNFHSDSSSQSLNNLLPPKPIVDKSTKKIKKEYGIITDIKTGITYNEEIDPVNYRKAKKRIQNRESALRMKKMRETDSNILEINRLKDDNLRLINENLSLKKEKEFLIDQIKFMQKIIKESNLEFKLKNTCSKNDDNDNVININTSNNEPVFYYDGSKQKIKGKLFNVFMVCTLSLIYIIGECSLDGDNTNSKNINGNNNQFIHLNSIQEKEKNNFLSWYYLSKGLLILIFILIIPLLKEIGKIFQYFKKKYKRN